VSPPSRSGATELQGTVKEMRGLTDEGTPNGLDLESLRGRVALVTGASRGIGAATAMRLAADGARVVCSARTLSEGDQPLSRRLARADRRLDPRGRGGGDGDRRQPGRGGELPRADRRDPKGVYGPVEVLVNNAGGRVLRADRRPQALTLGPLWRVTVTAPLLLAQLTLPGMIAAGFGRIVNISSESAAGPGSGPYSSTLFGDTAYGAQKAALERLTQGLAEEVESAGIGVAAVAPSQIVPTPGAIFNRIVTGPKTRRPRTPPTCPRWSPCSRDSHLRRCRAGRLLPTAPGRARPDSTGGAGRGFDGRPVSGLSQR